MSYSHVAIAAMERSGFKFSKKWGQNFIFDESFLSHIVDEAGITSEDNILEIGPGAGTLTAEMAQRGANIVCLEIDETLEPVLNAVLIPYPNVQVKYGDALKVDLFEATSSLKRPFKLVANLPYYITADIICHLIETHLPISEMTIMVQREAAMRILGKPSTKDYCVTAALIRCFGVGRIGSSVPSHIFMPRPHVESSLVHIKLNETPPEQIIDEKCIIATIKAAFHMRRKTMANNIMACFNLSNDDAKAVLEDCGLDTRIRGEALDEHGFIKLSNSIAKKNRII